MSHPVIFLNPSVLMRSENQVQNRFDQPACFDPEAFNLLKDLIQRIENVAIVLIIPWQDKSSASSLEQLKAAYQDCGLGEYIIGKIEDPDDPNSLSTNDGKLINDWLDHNQNLPNPLPIHNFVIISPVWWADRYLNRHVSVRNLLSELDTNQAYRILTQRSQDSNEIAAQDANLGQNDPGCCALITCDLI